MLRHPGASHLFVVDGKPVVTFWGFDPIDGTASSTSLVPARRAADDRSKTEDTDSPRVTQTADSSSLTGELLPPEAPETPPGSTGDSGATWRTLHLFGIPWWWPLLGFLLLLALLLLFFRGCAVAPIDPPRAPPPIGENGPPSPPTPGPDHKGSTGFRAPIDVPSGSGTDPTGGAGVLVIPEAAVETGEIDFIDGHWLAETSLYDARTDKPIELEYVIEGGQGTVKVRREDGSRCSAAVSARMENSELWLSGPGPILCDDGTSYGRPRLRCRPGAGGAADCVGLNSDDSTYEVRMRRAGSSPGAHPSNPSDRVPARRQI